MDFIKAIDWLFVSQLIILCLVFWIGSYFYKHSGWLHTNKNLKIHNQSFPKFNRFIEKHFNNNGFLFWVFFIIICIPAALGGMLFIIIVFRGTFNEFIRIIDQLSWVFQVIMCVSFILFYFLMRIWWDSIKKKLQNKNDKNFKPLE